MNVEDFRNYCLSKPKTTEDFPFDQDTLVFRIETKIYCLVNIRKLPLSVNLKCDPDYAIELREKYDAISPGYHMNKKHWNTICLDELGNDELLMQLVDHSYEMVVKGLPKKVRDQLK